MMWPSRDLMRVLLTPSVLLRGRNVNDALPLVVVAVVVVVVLVQCWHTSASATPTERSLPDVQAIRIFASPVGEEEEDGEEEDAVGGEAEVVVPGICSRYAPTSSAMVGSAARRFRLAILLCLPPSPTAMRVSEICHVFGSVAVDWSMVIMHTGGGGGGVPSSSLLLLLSRGGGAAWS